MRFLSNPSTGKTGFAVARAARAAGHEVTLVTGVTSLATPKGVKRVDVVSARDMLAAVLAEDFDCMVATAAVADWRPKRCARRKLKKSESSGVLELVRNPDVLKTAASKRKGAVFVGFAAETGNPVAEAARKSREKKLDFTVANDVTEKGCGFGGSTNRVALVRADGDVRWLPMMSKDAIARHIVRMAQACRDRRAEEKTVEAEGWGLR